MSERYKGPEQCIACGVTTPDYRRQWDGNTVCSDVEDCRDRLVMKVYALMDMLADVPDA